MKFRSRAKRNDKEKLCEYIRIAQEMLALMDQAESKDDMSCSEIMEILKKGHALKRQLRKL